MTYRLLRSKIQAEAPKTKVSPAGLRRSDPSDADERETDSTTNKVMTGRASERHWSLSHVNLQHRETPRAGLHQTTPSPGDSSLVSLGQAASNLRQAQEQREQRALANGPVLFRVPTTGDLKALFTSGNVPVAVLKNRVELALTRMAKEKRLKTTDSVATIMSKVFPAAGGFDEKAYEDAVDVTNRKQVYQSVVDAETKVTSTDKPKLKTVMQDAATLIDTCVGDTTNLASVFGSKKDQAKGVYKKAKTALSNAISSIDSSVTTDYNLDDPEIGLGGWARFSDQKVHFTQKVVKVTNENEAKATIIHESSHLADSTVKDKGYYGSPGFEGMEEDEKVTNAAHYEEVPRRNLGASKYKDSAGHFIDFKPGTSASGASETFEEKAKRKASEYFRKAWDKAVDVDKFIRKLRMATLAGSTVAFNAKKARVLEISQLMHLTVHEQPAATASINQMDVVLAEGVAHAIPALKKAVPAQTVIDPFQLKTPPLGFGGFKPRERVHVLEKQLELKPIPGLGPPVPTVDDAAAKVVEDSIKAGGSLVGSYDDDKKLLDWLVAEYKKPL